jgi:hypothetical protein
MNKLRGKLTYANVMSTIAVFIALGGATAFAAGQLAKNSVGTKQIKKNAVTGQKVKDGSLTGADINAATLGTVPKATNASKAESASKADSASHADSASKADNADQLGGAGAGAYVKGADAVGGGALGGTYASPTLKAAEASHQVGTAGNPAFEACKGAGTFWQSPPSQTVERVYYYRDPYGIVHIGGSVKCAEPPENGHNFFILPEGFRPSNQLDFAANQTGGSGSTQILSNGRVVYNGSGADGTRVSLDGVDFRCAPSGVNGCP